MTHTHEHSRKKIDLAVVGYSLILIAIEVCLQLRFGSDHDGGSGRVLRYELYVQIFHGIGTVLLGILQFWIANRAKKNTTRKFFEISTLIAALHIILLHLLPRLIGISLHAEPGGEWHEYIALAGIVIFVTIFFALRDPILEALGLKGKYFLRLSKKE